MLHLQALAKQEKQKMTVTLKQRLPHYLVAPCELEVWCQVRSQSDFYTIELELNGVLTTQCQRCAEEFALAYANQSLVAACLTEERAEQLLAEYETIVAPGGYVNLEDLVVDELHLGLAPVHPRSEDCSGLIKEGQR